MTQSAQKFLGSSSQLALFAALAGGMMLMASAPVAVAAPDATPTTAPAPAAQSSNEIPEVVVTAQRRSQNLQNVPISAQVVGGRDLAQQNITNVVSLTETLPAVKITPGGRNTDMYIRGIGSGNNESFDQSVATFVDDVYDGRSRGTAATFLDVNRIEILKGPQSTFFGNNAIAGALNIITNKPTDTFQGSARALYGSYGEYSVEGAAGGPVTDKMDVRAAVVANGMDGWINNETNGEKLPSSKDFAGRLSVLWKPTDNLDVTAKIEGSSHTDNSGPYYQIFSCPPPAPFVASGFCSADLALHVPTGLTNNNADLYPGVGNKLDTSDAQVTANYKAGSNTITSVTAYSQHQFNTNLSADGGPNIQLSGQNPEKYWQFSQELRIASPVGHTIEYMAGIYYQYDHLYVNQEFGYFFLTPKLATNPVLGSYLPLGQKSDFTQEETIISPFGQLVWNVTDKLKLSGGLRATSTHKSYNWDLFYGTQTTPFGGIIALPAAIGAAPNVLGIGTAGTLNGSRTDQALMPSGQIQYQITPQMMGYASYSRGFKAGGFNGQDNSAIASRLPFNPEYVNAYEVGVKSKLFDNRVLLNLDAFYMDYRDLQVAASLVQGSGAVLSFVSNAASSVSKGVELEGEWRVTPDLTLETDTTYLNAYYGQYANASPTARQQLNGMKAQSLSGRPTAYSPMWSGTVRGSYRFHLPRDYDLTTELSGFFTSRYYFGTGTDDPLISQGSYARLDGRMTLALPDRRWTIDLIGRNLTNQAYYAEVFAFATSPGSTVGNRGEPRSVALQVNYRW